MALIGKEARIFELLTKKQGGGGEFTGKETRIFELLTKKDSSTPQDVPGVAEQPVTGPEPLGFRDVATGFTQNFLPSAGRLVGDTLRAVAHPIETGKALGSIAAGGVEKLIPGGEDRNVKSFDKVTDFFKERYGGIENIKKTIRDDPAGFLSDLSVFLNPAASAAGAVAKTAKLGATVAKGASAVSKGLKAADKLTNLTTSVPAGIIKKGANAEVFKNFSNSLVSTSVKFRKTFDVDQLASMNKLAKEFLDSGEKVTIKSLKTLRAAADAKKKAIRAMLGKGTGGAVRVKVSDVTQNVDTLIEKIKKNPLSTVGSEANLNFLEKFNKAMKESKNLSIGRRAEKRIDTIINKVSKTSTTSKVSMDIIRMEIQRNIKQLRKKSKANPNIVKDLDMLKKFETSIAKKGDQVLISPKELKAAFDDLKSTEAFLTPTQVQKLKVAMNKEYAGAIDADVGAITKVATDEVRRATKSLLEANFPELKNLNLGLKKDIDFINGIMDTLVLNQKGRTFGAGLGAVSAATGGAAVATASGSGKIGEILGKITLFNAATISMSKLLNNPNIQLAVARAVKKFNTEAGAVADIAGKSAPALFQAGRASRVSGADKLSEEGKARLKKIRGF